MWTMRLLSRRRLGLTATLLLATVPATGADAVDLFVTRAGVGSACTQASPCPLATALASAVVGDTIYVGGGVYTGSGTAVVTLDKTVSLLGGWDGALSGAVKRDSFANGTTLDGQNSRRVVTITGGSPTINGFAITRGDATGLTDSCSGSSNEPGGCGGGIFVFNASPIISNNDIGANVASSALVSANARTGYGGGIHASYARGITIVSNTIRGNTASTVTPGSGGGISLYHSAGARIANNRILDNVGTTLGGATAWGGGVALGLYCDNSVVENNLLRGNVASSSHNGMGNAIFTWYSTVILRDNCIASDYRGESAVYLGSWTGGSFERNRVMAGADAAALEIVYGIGTSPLVANNVLVGGDGTDAVVLLAGPPSDPAAADLRHNTIIGDGTTIGVLARNSGSANLTNNIVAGHAHGVSAESGGSLTVDHTLFWNNVDDGERGTDPVDGNPLFVNAPRGDFHIQEGSAASNAGVDDGVDDDIDHEARPGSDGVDVGADELAPWAFDFGTATSPAAAGYTAVSHVTVYQPSVGYGWVSGTIASRDRGSGDDLTRDFNFTPLGAFAVDVPAGRYRVTLTMGDRTTAHGQMGVFLEGQQVASVSTQANEFKSATYEVTVQDGQLTLLLDDLGGADPNVVINALVIAKALPLRLDLGTAGSPVASGYAGVAPATAYSPTLGGGWLAGVVQARDRGTSDPLLRDFNFTRLGLFGLFLANGVYDLTVTYGDATTAHDLMATAVQGDGVGSLTTAVNQFVSRTYRTCVADNLARVLFVDAGGKDANVAVAAVEAAEPAAPKFDFGTAGSPLASGYLRVTQATTYSSYRGYGWLSGTVASRDRGAGDDLTRDFNFTHDGTFVVDVLPGRYRVTVLVGDVTTAHDQMGVWLEGEQVDTISTLANQATTRAYTVNVSDGQLTLELRDLGGSDANAVINALEVR